ncbi:MAG TPA: hypothetical protein VGK38_00730, partial [Prolixibacteraceae bacterium]
INGKVNSPEVANGYAILKNNWKNGDIIEINLPMPVRKIAANQLVTNDNGKLAYQRGPLVYCFEDKDNNNGRMFDDFVLPEESATSQFEEKLLGGVVTLSMKGNQVIKNGNLKTIEPVTLKAIPYYAWNNRGTANMLIWMPNHEATAIMKPEPALADSAHVMASSGWAPGLNDGFDPKNSGDTDKSYFYWWQKKGSDETVNYEFKTPITLSESSVYWLNMDHYDGNYRVPENWHLFYMDNNKKWIPVETSEDYSVKTDCYNMVKFKPVKTIALQLKAKLQKGNSGGILEWKVK